MFAIEDLLISVSFDASNNNNKKKHKTKFTLVTYTPGSCQNPTSRKADKEISWYLIINDATLMCFCPQNQTSISSPHRPDAALMLLFGYGAMWRPELCLLLTEAVQWTGCSWVSPGSRWAAFSLSLSLWFSADLQVVCFSGWEPPFAPLRSQSISSLSAWRRT